MAAQGATSGRRWIVVVAVAVVVAAVVVTTAVLLSGRQSSATPDRGRTPSASASAGSPSAKPTSSPSASGSASADPSASPKSTAAPTRRAPTAAGKPSPGKPPTVGTGSTVPVEPVKTKEPVPLDHQAAFGTGVTVRLSKITAVQGRAIAPGEIAGPALRLDVQVANGSARTVDLRRLVIFVSYGSQHTPANGLTAGSRQVATSVPADSTASGRYVFAVPKDQRRLIRVEVSYSGEAPTVAFEGSAPQ